MGAGGGHTGDTGWLVPVAHRLQTVADELLMLAAEPPADALEPGADPAPDAVIALNRACDDAAAGLGAEVTRVVARLLAAADRAR